MGLLLSTFEAMAEGGATQRVPISKNKYSEAWKGVL